jgi:hypothetical protein
MLTCMWVGFGLVWQRNTGAHQYVQRQNASMSGMCAGYNDTNGYMHSEGSSTADQCRAACDADSSCQGYSFGVHSPPPPAPQPSPPPPAFSGDRRRQLLQSSSAAGYCYLMHTQPTAVELDTEYTGSASCYAKGNHAALLLTAMLI